VFAGLQPHARVVSESESVLILVNESGAMLATAGFTPS